MRGWGLVMEGLGVGYGGVEIGCRDLGDKTMTGGRDVGKQGEATDWRGIG